MKSLRKRRAEALAKIRRAEQELLATFGVTRQDCIKLLKKHRSSKKHASK